MKHKKLICIVLLVTAITFPLSPALAESQMQATSEGRELHLETFADRVVVKEGEIINIKAWVESELMDSVTVAVFFAKDRLALKGDDSRKVSLPISSPITFTFTGREVGKSNVLTYVSGLNKETNKMITTSQQIQGIEVRAPAQKWSALLSSPLSGVILGAILTFLTTVLITIMTDHLEKRGEKSKRRQWVLTNLPAQLEATSLAVHEGREAKFELWMDKLLTEGYYTELQQLIKKEDAEKILKTGFRLRDYERDRQETYLDVKERYQDDAEKLSEILDKLRQN